MLKLINFANERVNSDVLEEPNFRIVKNLIKKLGSAQRRHPKCETVWQYDRLKRVCINTT